MAKWKPKTIFGKIVKGATFAIGGAAAIATGVGAVGGLIGGTGALAGAVKGVGGLLKGGKKVLSKVSAGATKLVTGQSKEENKVLRDIKKETKDAVNKLKFVEKLKSATTEKEAAEMAVNLTSSEIEEIENETGQKINKTGFDSKILIYAGAALAALIILPKLLKK